MDVFVFKGTLKKLTGKLDAKKKPAQDYFQETWGDEIVRHPPYF